jgi:hypothetical protein
MFIMLILNVLIFFQKKAQSVEYGFFICISENKKGPSEAGKMTEWHKNQ